MDFGSINWWTILICVVVSMIVGSLWFNPKTFFNVWWEAIGRKANEQPGTDNMVMVFGLTILSSFVQAVSMWFMAGVMGGNSWGSGMMVGFMLWLGFVAPTALTNKLFAGHIKAWFIEQGSHLVTFLLLGAITGAMR